MRNSARTGRCRHARHLFASPLAALLLPLVTVGFAAQAIDTGSLHQTSPAASSSHPARGTNSTLSEVTVEAASERALRHRVDHFVASVVTPPLVNESLLRWNKPICPLVSGLPRNMGEFILASISRAARDAHIRLAGEHCQANLFIIVTPQPDAMLKRWIARSPRVSTPHGIVPLKRFLHSTQPVRVWYNPEPGCPGGFSPSSVSGAELSAIVVGGSPMAPGTDLGPVHCGNSMDTQLTYADVRSISYAIVVADAKKLKHVKLGQLAGYVSLVGLADIQSDTDGGGAPTILRLFRDPNPPEGMTPWDQALLYSLYNTDQSGKLQMTDMELTMVKRITP